MTDKPTKPLIAETTKSVKYVEIDHVLLNGWGFLQIAKRIDAERGARAVGRTWPNYNADGFRRVFESEDEETIINAKLPKALERR
jgi:hypothetical protein